MKTAQQRPLPARDVRPLTTIFVWPAGQIKDKNKYSGLGPVPSCIPNQSQLDLPTSHPLQLLHDSSVQNSLIHIPYCEFHKLFFVAYRPN